MPSILSSNKAIYRVVLLKQMYGVQSSLQEEQMWLLACLSCIKKATACVAKVKVKQQPWEYQGLSLPCDCALHDLEAEDRCKVDETLPKYLLV